MTRGRRAAGRWPCAGARGPACRRRTSSSKGSPKTTSSVLRGVGQRVGRRCPGRRVPRTATGTSGAPVRSAIQAAPWLTCCDLAVAAVALGEDRRPLPRARARRVAVASAARSPTVRSIGIWPTLRMIQPQKPVKASCLTRKCAGRGARPKTSGPSRKAAWLATRMTGPVGGTRSACRARRGRGCGRCRCRSSGRPRPDEVGATGARASWSGPGSCSRPPRRPAAPPRPSPRSRGARCRSSSRRRPPR